MFVVFEQFTKLIKEFDSLSKKTISQCKTIVAQWSELGQDVGSAINNACKNRIEIKRNENSLNWKSELAYRVSGDLIEKGINYIFEKAGEAWTNMQVERTKKKILDTTPIIEQDYNELFPMLLKILDLQINTHIAIIKDEANIIRSMLLSDNKKDWKNGITKIQSHVNALYKCEYRKILGEQLGIFFDNYIQQLDNLECFSNWINSELIINKEDLYTSIVLDIFTKILNFDLEDSRIEKKLMEILISKPNLSIKQTDFLTNTVKSEEYVVPVDTKNKKKVILRKKNKNRQTFNEQEEKL